MLKNRFRQAAFVMFAVATALPAFAVATHTFSDVDDGRFFTEPVTWASENGITTGRTPTIFDPDAPVTRGEAVTFLRRYDENIVKQTIGSLTCDAGDVAYSNGATFSCRTPTLQYEISDWATESLTTVDEPQAAHGAMTIGANGLPIISYYEIVNDDLELYYCTNPSCSSGFVRGLDTSADDVGDGSSIAIADDDRPVVAFYDKTHGWLNVRKCGDSSCTTSSIRTLDDTGDVGQDTSIVVGTNNRPVIAYRDVGNGNLKISSCSSHNCAAGGAERTVDSSGNVTGVSSMAIGTNGNPIISYNTSNSLMLYVCTTSSCSSGVARMLYASGTQASSVAIGSDGRPIVSFSAQSAGDLRFYRCANVTCSSGASRDLDLDGVGVGSAIVVGVDGNPMIGYSDNLKAAIYRCTALDCSSGISITVDSASQPGGDFSAALLPDGSMAVSYYNAFSTGMHLTRIEMAVADLVFE